MKSFYVKNYTCAGVTRTGEFMKRKLWSYALLLFVMFSVVPVFAQLATVKGTLKDAEGKPVAGANVQLYDKETGRKINFKSGKNGELLNIGVPPGSYKVTVTKDGKTLFEADGFPVNFKGEYNALDIDLKPQQQQAQQPAAAQQAPPPTPTPAQTKGLTPEQKKEMEEAQKKNAEIQKENAKIGNLNTLLKQAEADHVANNDAEAVNVMKQATLAGPNYDQVWGLLAQYQNAAKQYDDAAVSAKKAVDLATASTDPKAKLRLGAWQNMLGQAYSKQKGHGDEAVAAYQAAAQADPPNAAMYYYNMGAVLTNTGKIDAANAAFDKAIAADPSKADAYYQKGINLMQKATVDSAGKIVPPPGTAESLNKYLELQPNGPHAGDAQQILASLGEKVQTSYGKAKKK